MIFGESALISSPALRGLFPAADVMPEALESIGADLRWLRTAARDPLALQSHCLCSAEGLLGPD